MAGPDRSRSPSPRSSSAPRRRSRSSSRRPGRRCRSSTSSSSRTASRRRSTPGRHGRRRRRHRRATGSSSPASSASRRCPTSSPAPARIIVTAARPVLRGIRTVESTATRDVQVRLERPRVSVVSTHHYINLGGTEMVRLPRHARTTSSRACWSATSSIPATRRPAPGRGRHDHRPGAARRLLRAAATTRTSTRRCASSRATPPATRRAPTSTTRVFPKPFKKSRIELDDKFLDRVVPAILEGTNEVKPDRRHAGEVPRDQRRAAPEERREDRRDGRSRPRRRCCGAAWSSIRSPTAPSRPRSPTSAPTSTRARRSTSRPTSASTWPRSPATRSSPPTAARCSSPRSSASTATA